MRECGIDLLRLVDIAVRHATAQCLGRHVDQFDLVGAADDLVGNGLPLRDPGDLLYNVVERLKMLDIDGGDDVDARGEQLFDVLPALGVAPAGDVAVSQLVYQGDLWTAGESTVESNSLKVPSRYSR
ncbi:hypothetical protein Sliba_80250 [Streptomyces nigrescens]|uniref:Uncharacterized protein n=1 Tax=Streptomyces nigrescens TaxID=1920 RepID=A0A640TXH8_STRNI|nr:hypothetical protein Sliba_80250 [Streptomyces libani subsp. libani]GGW08720.1 hypothetical protein GCM10010500_80110 [Streptomyces libani subsp. libani]